MRKRADRGDQLLAEARGRESPSTAAARRATYNIPRHISERAGVASVEACTYRRIPHAQQQTLHLAAVLQRTANLVPHRRPQWARQHRG